MICMSRVHKRAGAMRICLGVGMLGYAMYAMRDRVQILAYALRDYAQETEGKSGSNDSKGILAGNR